MVGARQLREVYVCPSLLAGAADLSWELPSRPCGGSREGWEPQPWVAVLPTLFSYSA